MMQLNNITFEEDAPENKDCAMYRLEEQNEATFFPGRQAAVLFRPPGQANFEKIGAFVRSSILLVSRVDGAENVASGSASSYALSASAGLL